VKRLECQRLQDQHVQRPLDEPAWLYIHGHRSSLLKTN
jgi:hypothetical protein